MVLRHPFLFPHLDLWTAKTRIDENPISIGLFQSTVRFSKCRASEMGRKLPLTPHPNTMRTDPLPERTECLLPIQEPHEKRARPSGRARFHSALPNQYFRVSPFCSEKYVVRSSMSVSDRACTCPPMMGLVRLPVLYSCSAWSR